MNPPSYPVVPAGSGLRLDTRKGQRVGFFCCPSGRGRIVRVGLHGEGKPPRFSTIDRCPNCGERHEAALTWRKTTDLDAGREPEVVIEAVPS